MPLRAHLQLQELGSANSPGVWRRAPSRQGLALTPGFPPCEADLVADDFQGLVCSGGNQCPLPPLGAGEGAGRGHGRQDSSGRFQQDPQRPCLEGAAGRGLRGLRPVLASCVPFPRDRTWPGCPRTSHLRWPPEGGRKGGRVPAGPLRGWPRHIDPLSKGGEGDAHGVLGTPGAPRCVAAVGMGPGRPPGPRCLQACPSPRHGLSPWGPGWASGTRVEGPPCVGSMRGARLPTGQAEQEELTTRALTAPNRAGLQEPGNPSALTGSSWGPAPRGALPAFECDGRRLGGKVPRGEGAGRAEPAPQRPCRPVYVEVCEQPRGSFSFLPPAMFPRWSPTPHLRR